MKCHILMLLASSATALCLQSGSAKHTNTKPKEQSNSTILHFDDIPTHNGLAKPPSPYSHLTFSSFDIFSPKDPALTNWITKHDLNCAITSPNALIGSRYDEKIPASIRIADPNSTLQAGIYPFFTLRSFYIKPMDAPPPGTTIYVKGYSYTRDEPFTWHVEFENEYHLPFLVKLEEYSRLAWEELYKVEFWADFGEDKLDWEFCLDELEVQFIKMVTRKDRQGMVKQMNLV